MATITREETAPDGVREVLSDTAARIHLLAGFAFLLVGAAAGLVVALKLTFVGLFDGTAALSFGRLQPAYTGAVLFGWITLAQIGAVYYLVPRLTGSPLWNRRLADLSFGLLFLSFATGIGAVLAGRSQGRELLEFPWWVDVGVVAGLAGATLVVTRSIVLRREPVLYISLWFFLGGMWWMLLNYTLGALPGTTGVDLEVLTRAAATGVQLGWVLPVGIGIGYYLVPLLSGNPLYSHRLGVISFWSLALTIPWLGPSTLTNGPAPAWLETVGTMFTIALLIPIGSVLANWALTMQGAWERLRTAPPLAFTAAGAAFLLLLPVQMAGLTLRAPNAVLQFTPWVEAGFVIVVWGVGTSWVLGLVHHARPSSWAGGQLWLTALSAGLLVMVLWIEGLTTGFGWSSSPVSEAFTNFGEGWVNTTARQAPFDALRWLAWVGILAGQLAGALALVRGRWAPSGSRPDEPGAAADA